MTISVSTSERPSPRRCVYCLDDIPLDAMVGCPDCRTALHAECWAELPDCPTVGCTGTPLDVSADSCPACFRRDTGGEHCAECQAVFESLGLVADPTAPQTYPFPAEPQTDLQRGMESDRFAQCCCGPLFVVGFIGLAFAADALVRYLNGH